jgi:transketolase
VAIISRTVKGRGVSVFENKVKFHGGRPSQEEYATAYAELDAQIAQLED